MVEPLIRMMEHEIANCDWSVHSESVIWSAAGLVAFLALLDLANLLQNLNLSFMYMKPFCGRTFSSLMTIRSGYTTRFRKIEFGTGNMCPYSSSTAETAAP